MVKFERNRGFRVVLPTAHDIAEIFSIRLALEVPAVRRATRRADANDRDALRRQYAAMEASVDDESAFIRHDQQLHALLLDIEGNSRTKSIINNLRDATRLLGASTMGSERSLTEVLLDHLPIVEAFEGGDSEAAALAMDRHLRTTGRLLLQQVLRQNGKQEEEGEIWNSLIS
jgi:DNA-binding GntR family transcriptional regulator